MGLHPGRGRGHLANLVGEYLRDPRTGIASFRVLLLLAVPGGDHREQIYRAAGRNGDGRRRARFYHGVCGSRSLILFWVQVNFI